MLFRSTHLDQKPNMYHKASSSQSALSLPHYQHFDHYSPDFMIRPCSTHTAHPREALLAALDSIYIRTVKVQELITTTKKARLVGLLYLFTRMKNEKRFQGRAPASTQTRSHLTKTMCVGVHSAVAATQVIHEVVQIVRAKRSSSIVRPRDLSKTIMVKPHSQHLSIF